MTSATGVAAGLDEDRRRRPTELASDVLLIRHGQTNCTIEGRFCGVHEGDLTEVGRQMARRLGRHPALDGVGTVLSSPARRAFQTAEAIAGRLGVAVAVDERLRELSFGQWEDRLPSEVPADLHRRWECDPALFCPPGGETGLEVMARAVAAVRDAALSAPRVAVVTHKAPVRLVLAFFLGLRPSRYREIGPITVGSLSWLRLNGDRLLLKALGDVGHLPEPWRADPDRAGS